MAVSDGLDRSSMRILDATGESRMIGEPLVRLPDDAPWRTMVQLLTAVGERGAAPALTATSAGGEIVKLSGEELRDLVARGAALLEVNGVAQGSAVAVHLDNRSGLEALLLHWAAQWMGAVAVPVGTRLTAREASYIVDHADVSVICSALDGLELVTTVASGLPDTRVLDVSRGLVELTAALTPRHPATVSENDLADILYTSGTTGRPKGVQLTHANNVAAGLELAAAVELTADDVFQSAIPYFTSTGAHANPLIALSSGARLVMETEFDQHAFLPRAAAEGTTSYLGAPSMLRLVTRDADLSRRPASLRLLMFGGSVTTATALEQLAAAFPGCGLTNLYGQTEGGPGGSVCKPKDILDKPASIGDRGMGPNTSVAVVRDDGTAVDVGELGEIVIRSPAVMAGYRGEPDATAVALAGGWLHTGDVAHVDSQGFMFYADRRKDLIIRGGMNISSAEVESVLLGHPRVDDVAVIGVEHDVLGEDVVAVVVSSEGVDPAELTRFARTMLADYKAPRRVVFVHELPRNAMGKVLKRELRQM